MNKEPVDPIYFSVDFPEPIPVKPERVTMLELMAMTAVPARFVRMWMFPPGPPGQEFAGWRAGNLYHRSLDSVLSPIVEKGEDLYEIAMRQPQDIWFDAEEVMRYLDRYWGNAAMNLFRSDWEKGRRTYAKKLMD